MQVDRVGVICCIDEVPDFGTAKSGPHGHRPSSARRPTGAWSRLLPSLLVAAIAARRRSPWR
jgi:hypothetical protein